VTPLLNKIIIQKRAVSFVDGKKLSFVVLVFFSLLKFYDWLTEQPKNIFFYKF